MQNEAVGVVCCVLLFAIPLMLVIGAVLLRGGIWLANKCLPKPDPSYSYSPGDRVEDWNEDDEEWGDERPRRPEPSLASSTSIPAPNFGYAMAIAFICLVVRTIVNIPINLALGLGLMPQGANDEAMQFVAAIIQLPVNFLIDAGLLTALLPTTFLRGCLVVLFEYLIVIAISIVVFVPLVMTAVLMG